jgi:hypothetical protein
MLVLPNVAFIKVALFDLSVLTIVERTGLVASLYTNPFTYILEPVTLTTIILSLLLAVNFLLIRFVRQFQRRIAGRVQSTVSMLLTGHCVACGASILAPLISLVGGTGGSYFSASRYYRLQFFALALNVIALTLTYRSIRKSARVAQTVKKQLTYTPRGYRL